MKPSKFLSLLSSGIAIIMLLSVGTSRSVNAQEPTVLEFDAPISGTLGEGDSQLSADGSFFDVYTFEGRAGERVLIRMTSTQLDSYLVLLDPNGNSLVQDDDSAGNLDAQIVYTLPVDGRYTVYANAYSTGQAGSYQIELQAADASTPTVATSTALPRYFCDESGTTPITKARRKDGVVGPLIEWTQDLALPNLSAAERCRRVASNLDTVHGRLGRNFAITAGRLQNLPVVCAGTAPGVCDPDGLILTASSRDNARQLAIRLGTAINALRSAPPDPSQATSTNSAQSRIDDPTPLAVAPQFNFFDILSYSNCLEDVIQLYQDPQRLKRSGRRSDCLSEVFARYPNGISRSQALEIITAADRYATSSRRDTLLYPPRGQRVRVRELFGFTYAIDQPR
ncbi:COP23 domain-containing protein [Thermocoleostomius sinensis]|jgi:hypothetical protein|uniref:COP23 domain-containing protein n=1 Tax=Thermocoleostomius sinensis A174 TaxID=2016057 RepID=A0A9E8ZAT6_9CYAN|nr:COP23 domain-containing protein [Thermocoleostomius sinensis]WAL58467.1 COP23 domain-containing protein [Thermocoleostomius sinensis A174]